jgi:hypothetical protein
MAYYQVTDRRDSSTKIVEVTGIRDPRAAMRKAVDDSGLGKVIIHTRHGDVPILDKRTLIVALAQSNSLVLDQKLGWGLEYIPEENLPDDARLFRFHGKMVYYLIRSRDKDTEGRLEPYKRPATIAVPPQKLWRATKIKPLVLALFRPKKSSLEKLKIGLMIAILIGLIVAIYIIVEG